MTETEAHQASTMYISEDADAVGESSILNPFGDGYLFRVLDVLKPGGFLETELEVLGLKSGKAVCQPRPLESLSC